MGCVARLTAIVGKRLLVGSRSVSLPKRHDVAAIFELPAEDACMHNRGEGLAQLERPPEKNLKSERSPTPVPQLTNGPYSQLLRVADLGDRIVAAFVLRRVTPAATAATDANAGEHIATAIKRNKKASRSESNFFPSRDSNLRLLTKKADPTGRPFVFCCGADLSRRPVPSARRPCRSSSRRSGCRRNLPAPRAGEPSGRLPVLRAWCRWRRSW